jgi:hypothetical protein
MARHQRPQGAVQGQAQGALSTVAETVVVQPERQRRVVSPAEYESVAEEVLVQPEQRRIVNFPATYQTVARRVLVREGSSRWRQVRIPRHCRF